MKGMAHIHEFVFCDFFSGRVRVMDLGLVGCVYFPTEEKAEDLAACMHGWRIASFLVMDVNECAIRCIDDSMIM